jgi:hypothetical protein
MERHHVREGLQSVHHTTIVPVGTGRDEEEQKDQVELGESSSVPSRVATDEQSLEFVRVGIVANVECSGRHVGLSMSEDGSGGDGLNAKDASLCIRPARSIPRLSLVCIFGYQASNA